MSHFRSPGLTLGCSPGPENQNYANQVTIPLELYTNMPETGKNQPEMILGVQTVAWKVLPNMPIILIFVDFLGFWG